jgi:cytochrome bd-type quinol oxidase subunit 1
MNIVDIVLDESHFRHTRVLCLAHRPRFSFMLRADLMLVFIFFLRSIPSCLHALSLILLSVTAALVIMMFKVMNRG